ncbi:hypothetical protein LQL77_31010 [Rhodococcus cerastii]|nr:hypothetical protein [Rhodococcus cerastii]
MNITRRTTRIASTIVAGLSLAALGGGIAAAAPVPAAAAADDSIISVTIDKASGPFTTFNGIVDCRDEGDRAHPYLVLDQDAKGDNESRWARHATFNTGDKRPLGLLEFIAPIAGEFRGDDIRAEDPDFHAAQFFVKIDMTDGHRSATVHCASTLEAAHQK